MDEWAGVTPGTICVASGDLARYSRFCNSMMQLWAPPETQTRWSCGLNVAANFNHCIRNMEGDWVWIMGDDHVFAPDTLMRLLKHDVDVVVPIVIRRQPPFIPVLFKRRVPNSTSPQGTFPYLKWGELPQHGLIGMEEGLYVAGSAGMLIRKRVLDLVGDPWFEVGQCGREVINEDAHFCEKIAALGIELHADMDTWMGHVTPMTIWPSRAESGAWTTALDMGGPRLFQLPVGSADVIANELGGERVHDSAVKNVPINQGG